MTYPIGIDIRVADPLFFTVDDIAITGTELVHLRSANGKVRTVWGRLLAQGLPCAVVDGHGLPGCGAPDTMSVVRHPIPDLQVRGIQIVSVLEYCAVCGPGLPRLAAPTQQEIDDGWVSPAR